MKVVFRADASGQIGSGHVMRCLTLADSLAASGAEILFICREHPGNLAELVSARGYAVASLQLSSVSAPKPWNQHADWLGGGLRDDASDTAQQIKARFGTCDWLIVDHYALENDWQQQLRPLARKIMVIDDLADRRHDCDLLLDQTLGREADDYRPLTPAGCKLICGAEYALLRPEFSRLRPQARIKRSQGSVSKLLISMGGVDNDNLSCRILAQLQGSALPVDCCIRVVLGPTAPWLAEVQQAAERSSFATEVCVDVKDMAGLILESDLAIGAAGSSAWERCCLGLPTIMLVVAENQKMVAAGLAQRHAAVVLSDKALIEETLTEKIDLLVESSVCRHEMSQAAMDITSGDGAAKLLELMGI